MSEIKNQKIIFIGCFLLIAAINLITAVFTKNPTTIAAAFFISLIISLSLGLISIEMTAKNLKKTQDCLNLHLEKLCTSLKNLEEGNINLTFEVENPNHKTEKLYKTFMQITKSLEKIENATKNIIMDSNMMSKAAIEGNLSVRADSSKHKGHFKELIDGVNETLNTLVGHIDSMPAPAVIIDTDFTVRYINNKVVEVIGLPQKDIIGTKCYEHFKTSDCNSMKCACGRAMREKRPATSETDAHPQGLNLEISYTGVPVKDKKGNVIGALELISDLTAIKQATRLSKKQADYQASEVIKITESLHKMAEGNLDFNLEAGPADNDLEEIRNNFLNISNSVNQCVNNLKTLIEDDGGDALKRAANRNLTARVKGSYKGIYETMKENINLLLENMDNGLAQVYTSSEQIATASLQIGNGSQGLANSTSEQASTIEELSSSVQEIASMTKQTASNSKQAKIIAMSALEMTSKGVDDMSRLTEAINKIKASSDQTAKIIKTIDEIAFQTNLLALNAAVEAARAGEAGRGFAVVADEVRNLAMRSADAAKNTANLIEEQMKNAEKGVNLNIEVLKQLNEIHAQINKASIGMSEIDAATDQQAIGIDQINAALEQLNSGIQANVVNSEEFARSAEELSNQAQEMESLVSNFELSKLINQIEKDLSVKSRSEKQKLLKARPIYKDTVKIVKPEHILPFDNIEELSTF